MKSQLRGDLPQYAVADGVPVAVVDLFEMVDVDHQQRMGGGRGRLFQYLTDVRLCGGFVEYPRKRVVLRHSQHSRLALLFRGDILTVGDHVHGLVGVPVENLRPDAHPAPALPAIGDHKIIEEFRTPALIGVYHIFRRESGEITLRELFFDLVLRDYLERRAVGNISVPPQAFKITSGAVAVGAVFGDIQLEDIFIQTLCGLAQQVLIFKLL